MADQTISEEQKQALVRIYLSFRREHEDEERRAGPPAAGRRGAGDPGRGGSPRATEPPVPPRPGRHRLKPDRIHHPAVPGVIFATAGRL